MKHCFTLALVCGLMATKAQHPDYPGYSNPGRDFDKFNRFTQTYPWMPEFAAGKTLQMAVVTESKGKQRPDTFKFDSKGRLEYQYIGNLYVSNGLWYVKRPSTHVYTYADNGQLKEYTSSGKGFKPFHKEWTYLSAYKPLRIQSSKGSALVAEQVYTYNPDSTLQKNESLRYKRGKPKPGTRYEYLYNESKKIKRVVFVRKGKTRRIWNYDCNDKGVLQKKDTVWVCTSEGHDNKGRRIVTKHSSEYNGEEYKQVMYYKMVNGKEELNQLEHFRIKEKKELLRYSIHYPDSAEPYYLYVNYNTKGRALMMNRLDYVYRSNKDKLVSKKEWKLLDKNGRSTHGSLETYTDRGLPLQVLTYGKNGKELGRVDIRYADPLNIWFRHQKRNKTVLEYHLQLRFY